MDDAHATHTLQAHTPVTPSSRRNYLAKPHRTDALIDFVKQLIHHSFVLDALEHTAPTTWEHVEELVDDHRAAQASASATATSRLAELAPGISTFYTRLPLASAWRLYDDKYALSKRRFVAPSSSEIRHVFNLAQVLAMRDTGLRLVTFDGDQTLYSDGSDFSDPKLARYLVLLLHSGVSVALVTAAGYGYEGALYERRLSGFLEYMRSRQVPEEAASRFYVLGGECNFLLRLRAIRRKGEGVGPLDYELESREHDWEAIWSPRDSEVQELLNVAEESIRSSVRDLLPRARVIRKSRAVGLVAGGQRGKAAALGRGAGKSWLPRESLDEAVLRLHDDLKRANGGRGVALPFCAFNGGSDVWCDVGTKRVGVDGLRKVLGLVAECVLHIGDQFLNTGNDHAARHSCPCLWITNVGETKQVIKHVLRDALGLSDIKDRSWASSS